MKALIEIDEIFFKKLPEEFYGEDEVSTGLVNEILIAVMRGTPISEVHDDLIDRTELLKAMDTWPKFGCTADGRLVPCDAHLVPYVHYADMVQAVKGMPLIIEADKEGDEE